MENNKLDGIIIFYNSFQVFRVEKKLKMHVDLKIVPGPREISPNCGTALAFDYLKHNEVKELLKKYKLNFEGIFHYPKDLILEDLIS